jgi:hypothetical protein
MPKNTSSSLVEPSRDKEGVLVFKDAPLFKPNLTPAEVLALGSFGGTYFRDIKSGVTGQQYRSTWRELPAEWLKGLDVPHQVASSKYNIRVNKYKVDCGAKLDKKTDPCGLGYWEKSGWIESQDPYGWFQWYCRFYQGRRSADDARQISRWANCAGTTGRWRNNLISKVMHGGKEFDDDSVSPVVRQTLQHWGYRLTQQDYLRGLRRLAGVKQEPSNEEGVETNSAAAEEKAAAKRSANVAARSERASKRAKPSLEDSVDPLNSKHSKQAVAVKTKPTSPIKNEHDG